MAPANEHATLPISVLGPRSQGGQQLRSVSSSEYDTFLPSAGVEYDPFAIDEVQPNGHIVPKSVPLQLFDSYIFRLWVFRRISVE